MLVAGVIMAVAIVVVVVVTAKRARRGPQMLVIPQSTQWRQLRDPPLVAPQLLLAPHAPDGSIIRCYDAREHKTGLRMKVGVFDTPAGGESREWIGIRLLSDPVELSSSNTLVIALGAVDGMARTGWIRAGDAATGDVRLVANVSWYVPEVGSRRVHFVSILIDAMSKENEVELVHELCKGARFDTDTGRTIRFLTVDGQPCAPELTKDLSTFGFLARRRGQ
jgi:hypothetical protein